jgi:hypothetical protein
MTFDIPSGYVGWVTVTFGVNRCPPTKTATMTTILVGADGRACSSLARYPARWAFSRFYYARNGRRIAKLQPTGWGKGGMIWAESTETDGHEYRFFVGTETQLNAAYKQRALAPR